MLDQLIIGDKASYDDFGASVALRSIKAPPKKSIKETVPFSNKTYDFSKINGELYWEERELEYVFEITASTPEELEELKRAFLAWVTQVHEKEIHDPFIPDFHFVGTYDDLEVEDDEGLDKTTLTVTFTAYPYLVANVPTVQTLRPGFIPGGDGTIMAVPVLGSFVTGSAHRVDGTLTITFESDSTDAYIDYDFTVYEAFDGQLSGFYRYAFRAYNGTQMTITVPAGPVSIARNKANPSDDSVKNVSLKLEYREEVF